jgi:Restriction endonuclease
MSEWRARRWCGRHLSIGKDDGHRLAVQCKHWPRSPIGEPIVRRFIRDARAYDERAIFTTGEFSRPAKRSDRIVVRSNVLSLAQLERYEGAFAVQSELARASAGPRAEPPTRPVAQLLDFIVNSRLLRACGRSCGANAHEPGEPAPLKLLIRDFGPYHGTTRGAVQHTSTATLSAANASEKPPPTGDLPQRPRPTSPPGVRIEGIRSVLFVSGREPRTR